MKKTVLLPKFLFEKGDGGAVGYWLLFALVIVWMVRAGSGGMTILWLTVLMIVLPNATDLLCSPVCVIIETAVCTYVFGKLRMRMARKEIAFTGIYRSPKGKQYLFVTKLDRLYFEKYVSKHGNTAKNLFSGKQYAQLSASPEGRQIMGAAVYLTRNDCLMTRDMLVFQLQRRHLSKIMEIWPGTVMIDTGKRVME